MLRNIRTIFGSVLRQYRRRISGTGAVQVYYRITNGSVLTLFKKLTHLGVVCQYWGGTSDSIMPVLKVCAGAILALFQKVTRLGVTPPWPVPSLDEKGGGDTQTATWHYTLTATLNATHLTPERVFCGGAASHPEVCMRPCTEKTRPAARQR